MVKSQGCHNPARHEAYWHRPFSLQQSRWHSQALCRWGSKRKARVRRGSEKELSLMRTAYLDSLILFPSLCCGGGRWRREKERAAGGSEAERSWITAVVQWNFTVPFKNEIQFIFRIWSESRRNRQAGENQDSRKEFVSFMERICNQVWRGCLIMLIHLVTHSFTPLLLSRPRGPWGREK